MSADQYNSAVHLDRPTEPSRNLRRWWGAVTVVLVAAVFTEAVFAGAMLSGAAWARAAHRLGALGLVGAAVAVGLIAVVTLRRIAHGLKLGLTLLALSAALLVQMVLGTASAHGANLLWLHVPLGVALVGLAGQAAASARGLGGN